MAIGKQIEKVVREKRWSITEFAREINTNRNNVYHIFGRRNIETELLQRISNVLDFDFFQFYISDETKTRIVSEQSSLYTTNAEIKRLMKKISVLEKEIKTLMDRLLDKEEIIALLKKTQK